MNEQFWKGAPKTFCDNANMAVAQGQGNIFMFALMSGGNARVFTFTPEHMKRVAQLIDYHIKSFEDKNGAIQIEQWTPEMKSPIQIKDIGK